VPNRLDAASLGSALVSFLLFLIFHVLVLRWRRAASALRVLVASCALFGALDAGLWLWVLVARSSRVAYSRPDLALAAAASLALYGLFAFDYVVGWFNLGETARRIRLLRELARAPGRVMTAEDVLRAYNADMIVTARLRRLVGSGQLRLREGRYTIGGRFFIWQARMLARLKVLMPMPDVKP
jgi:hypothetical protein